MLKKYMSGAKSPAASNGCPENTPTADKGRGGIPSPKGDLDVKIIEVDAVHAALAEVFRSLRFKFYTVVLVFDPLATYVLAVVKGSDEEVEVAGVWVEEVREPMPTFGIAFAAGDRTALGQFGVLRPQRISPSRFMALVRLTCVTTGVEFENSFPAKSRPRVITIEPVWNGPLQLNWPPAKA